MHVRRVGKSFGLCSQDLYVFFFIFYLQSILFFSSLSHRLNVMIVQQVYFVYVLGCVEWIAGANRFFELLSRSLRTRWSGGVTRPHTTRRAISSYSRYILYGVDKNSPCGHGSAPPCSITLSSLNYYRYYCFQSFYGQRHIILYYICITYIYCV